MPYVSDLYVTLTLDPSGYTTGVNSAVTSTKKLETEFNALDVANRKTATGLRAVGTSVAMMGSGVAMVEPKLAGLAIATSNIGMITAMVGPELKAIGFLHGELATKVKEATLALEGERLVMASVTGILGVGLIAGLIAWKLSTDAQNQKLEDQKKALENVNKAAQEYASTLNRLQSVEDKLAGRPQDKKDLQLKLKEQGLAMLSAKAGLGKGSTALENAQRQVSYESAINEYNKTWNALQNWDTDTAKLEAQRSNLAGKAGPLALSVAGNPNFYSDKTGGALTVGGIVSGVANAPIMPGSNAGGVPSGTVVNVLVNPGQWVDVPGTDVRVMRITNGG